MCCCGRGLLSNYYSFEIFAIYLFAIEQYFRFRLFPEFVISCLRCILHGLFYCCWGLLSSFYSFENFPKRRCNSKLIVRPSNEFVCKRQPESWCSAKRQQPWTIWSHYKFSITLKMHKDRKEIV